MDADTDAVDPILQDDLIMYVTEQHLTNQSKQRIQQEIIKQPPQSRILYRGHDTYSTHHINPFIWFSTTTSIKVAQKEFAGKSGVVYKIHAVQVPMLDINSAIGDRIKTYKDENEFLILGGGTFYKSDQLNEPGFTHVKDTQIYECWYAFKEPSYDDDDHDIIKPSVKLGDKIKNIINQISEDEYEFINDPTDIVGFDLTQDEKQMVFDAINEKKQENKKGGKKKSRKSRKTYRYQKYRNWRKSKQTRTKK